MLCSIYTIRQYMIFSLVQIAANDGDADQAWQVEEWARFLRHYSKQSARVKPCQDHQSVLLVFGIIPCARHMLLFL